jgi:hypothetical protein
MFTYGVLTGDQPSSNSIVLVKVYAFSAYPFRWQHTFNYVFDVVLEKVKSLVLLAVVYPMG